MSDGKPISAVVRALVILEHLSQVSGSSLEHLSRNTRLAKPTVYRFLQTLRELGYVKKDAGDRWFLTLKLFAVGSRTLDHLDLITVARPVAERLSVELGETVHLGILDDDAAIYVLKAESKNTIRMYSRVGKKIPLHCTAIGKTLLAAMDPPERERRLATLPLPPLTRHTLTDRRGLQAELERVAAAGLAEDAEEHEEGITCLAAPVQDHSGHVLAALSVSWPSFRFDPKKKETYGQSIRAAAAEIALVLGVFVKK